MVFDSLVLLHTSSEAGKEVSAMLPPSIPFDDKLLKFIIMRCDQHNTLSYFCLAHPVMRHTVGRGLCKIIFNGIVAFELWFSFLLEINNAWLVLIDANQIGDASIVISKMHTGFDAPYFLQFIF